MNIPRFTPIALLLCAAMLHGCCKKDNSDLPERSYTMSATMANPSGNAIFRATGPVYVTAVKTNNTLTISGIDTSGGTPVALFLFKIKDFYGPFDWTYTYDVTSESKAYFERSEPSISQTAFARAGVHISSVTKEKVTGTFAGTLTDSSRVTDGSFTALPKGF